MGARDHASKPCSRRSPRSSRLSARLDPVRPAADPRRRAGRRAQDRLGQYRRDQCAAHRPQGARRGDPAARRGQGRGGGAARRAGSGRTARSSGSPRSPPFSAISIPVWLRFKGGKGVATLLGVVAALAWPVADRGGGLAAGAARHALFLGRRHGRAALGAPVRGRPVRPVRSACSSPASPCSSCGSTAPISPGSGAARSRRSAGASRLECRRPISSRGCA